MEDSRLISLHDHLSEGMSRRGRRGGLGRVKGTPGTTAVLRTKRFEDQHMPDNRLYRGFVRGGVLGKRRLDRIIEDVLDKQEGKKMPWKALRRECVKQWRIENMADERTDQHVGDLVLTTIPATYLSKKSNLVSKK
ncbi:hypothetical protein FOZ63_032341 [Perkinsus olseni]|uniref:Uncharacterized protein n=1 Tax=Perkinsus olseni TaxID=32597 RepID=A0A7J6S472_PEROL|nr:hypothetical protein FOZ63_032341 [Perkinsus olseni]